MNKFISATVVLIIGLISCKSDGSSKISGAGATFPAPFYNIVFKNFAEETATNVNYGAIGSGGGIRNLKDKTVDFGATDIFLSDAEIQEMGAEVLHIPTALGAVVISYNLPGIKNLKLTSELISDIYRGKITKWNDPKIQALNIGLPLPDKNITPVYRSDGSGTTAVFSEYMSKTDQNWKKDIGTGKSLIYPVGVAGKGNPGVAGIIAETDGAMGYIGSEYALVLDIPAALLQNSSGNFIEANDKSISAAANIDLPADTRAIITNSSNPEAYPISTFTWIILYKEQGYNNRTESQAAALAKLLNYIISSKGQEIATKTHYASLPSKAQEMTKSIINSMTYNEKQLNTN